MFNFIDLNCPSCGANLQVNDNSQYFACEHCGNKFVLNSKASDLKPAERKKLNPQATYTRQLKQWVKVDAYEICLHEVRDLPRKNFRILAINVEYRNNGDGMLSCRIGQWNLFDQDGYTYQFEYLAEFFTGLPGSRLPGESVIGPEMRVRGWIVFKIPLTATVERLQFLVDLIHYKTVDFFFA